MKPGAIEEITIAIASDLDIVAARQRGRSLASQLGYSTTDATLIATAISELARNIVTYARHGEIVLGSSNDSARHSTAVVARDEGPGNADSNRTVAGGTSTSGCLGLGLAGLRTLMELSEL